MIKAVIFALALFTVYSVFLKSFLDTNSDLQKEVDEAIQPTTSLIKEAPPITDLGPEVDSLTRYRTDMLKAVNDINKTFKSPEKVTFIKKLITENKGFETIKKDLKNNVQFEKIKDFVLKFGSKNFEFIQPQKELSEKDAEFFEVNEPMTLDDYKKNLKTK